MTKINIKSFFSLVSIFFINIFLLLSNTKIINASNIENNQAQNLKEEISQEITKTIANFTQAIEIKKHSELVNLVNDSEITFLVYYYIKDSRNCLFGLKFLKELEEKIKFLVKYVIVDCDLEDFSSRSVCQKIENAPDSFPRMIRLDAPKVRINPYTNEQNNYSETVFKESNVNAKSLYTFMTAGIPDYSVDLSNENIDDYLNNKASVNKLILFTDKEKTPLLFKGLSTHFYDRLSLGIVKNDKRDIFNRFQIEKLPVLLLYISAFDDVILQEPIIDIYKGETKAENIIYAVDFMAKKEKNYIKQRKELENEEVGTKIKADNFGIIELNPDNLEYFYTRSSGRAIFTIVGNKPLNENFNIPEGIKQIARETAGFVMFFYLNCSGQFEKNYVSKFLKDKSCPEEDKLKLWYIAPDKIKESINEIRELYEEINDLSYYFIEKMLIDLYEEKGSVVEIIDEEYHFMINKAKKENKTPLVFLHDQVRI